MDPLETRKICLSFSSANPTSQREGRAIAEAIVADRHSLQRREVAQLQRREGGERPVPDENRPQSTTMGTAEDSDQVVEGLDEGEAIAADLHASQVRQFAEVDVLSVFETIVSYHELTE